MAEFSIGEYVNTPSDAIGKIVKKQMVCDITYTVQFNSGRTADFDGADLEPAPKLTPDEAWAQLPILIIEQVKALRVHYTDGVPVLYAGQRSNIRHECYKLLGGAGIKVEPVKERVTNMVEAIARAMGVRVV